MTTTHTDTILQVNSLAKRFNLEAGFFSSFGKFVYAVNGVSFAVKRNTALGLVGESGCGRDGDGAPPCADARAAALSVALILLGR